MNAALIAFLALLLNTNRHPSAFTFTRLVYHSSHCYGSCPAIDMEIDSNRDIIVHREFFFSRKGEVGEKGTGNFKGKLDQKTYFNLTALLIRSDYTKWKWDSILCCDGVVTTIIVYANGNRTHLISMVPPKEANPLIGFLYKLGTAYKLPRATGQPEIKD